VANIPYYLTSNLIRKLSETSNRPKIAVLLIQKEVAERLCAGPGDMSLLSVWAQMYFDCVLGPVVPARLFSPPPKVDSQVVVLRNRENPTFGSADKKILAQVIKAGFSNKRKTLLNSLSAGLQISKDQVQGLLEAAELEPKARPQELSLDQWVILSELYSKK
jgi:16S rRNA (adenine1518-N6/adenine1519-N6)-dimethyltransferase